MVGSRKKAVSRPEGGGFFERGSQPPLNQLEDSSSGVWGAAPAEIVKYVKVIVPRLSSTKKVLRNKLWHIC